MLRVHDVRQCPRAAVARVRRAPLAVHVAGRSGAVVTDDHAVVGRIARCLTVVGHKASAGAPCLWIFMISRFSRPFPLKKSLVFKFKNRDRLAKIHPPAGFTVCPGVYFPDIWVKTSGRTDSVPWPPFGRHPPSPRPRPPFAWTAEHSSTLHDQRLGSSTRIGAGQRMPFSTLRCLATHYHATQYHAIQSHAVQYNIIQ